jgi:hypothetical protein
MSKVDKLFPDCPTIYDAENLKEYVNTTGARVDGKIVPCRPLPFWGLMLRQRFKAAWMVFTGKADVVTWKY